MMESKHIQEAIRRFLDTTAEDAQSKYLLLDESERIEVAGWFRALQEGRSVIIEGVADPVVMDVELCTKRIRAVWARSCERRQQVASEALAGAGVDGTLGVIEQMLTGETPTVLA